jgi:hypothetical protein
MAGSEKRGVVFQRSQVVPVGPQTYVTVGADCEECASFYPQLARLGGVEIPNGVWDASASTEGHSGFKQGRMFYVFLQGSVESR